MTTHSMATPEGAGFELVLDADRRITAVTGPWPEERGAEFELHGALPPHAEIQDAPSHVVEFGRAQGRHVCMYDPDACQTCFCDAGGNVLYCRKMC